MDPLLSPQNPWAHLLWLLAAAVIGFIVPALLAWRWKLLRRKLIGPYALLALALLFGYIRFSDLDLSALLSHNWHWGLLLGLGLGLFLALSVRAQPRSERSHGLGLALDLLWLGAVYGLVDALFLSVLPILVVQQVFSLWAISAGVGGLLLTGLAAWAASLLVTAAYHLGYREFQGRALSGPLVGNGLISLAYLVAGNPLAALISHTAMHGAAVLRGPETTIQLPPHYGRADQLAQREEASLATGR